MIIRMKHIELKMLMVVLFSIYSCDQCEHGAARGCDLEGHIESTHEVNKIIMDGSCKSFQVFVPCCFVFAVMAYLGAIIVDGFNESFEVLDPHCFVSAVIARVGGIFMD
jgi:hypothetical protein